MLEQQPVRWGSSSVTVSGAIAQRLGENGKDNAEEDTRKGIKAGDRVDIVSLVGWIEERREKRRREGEQRT